MTEKIKLQCSIMYIYFIQDLLVTLQLGASIEVNHSITYYTSD